MSTRPRAVLLDVEGTTTPMSFVYERLFPYARQALPEFLERHRADPAVLQDLAALGVQHARDTTEGLGPPNWASPDDLGSASAYARWLMDRDSKAPGLKALQGRIWEQGYASGALLGEVYEDVPRALERWARAGVGAWIFSSGSVLAQRLLFAHTPAGDLTRVLRGHFDTASGGKREAASYTRIAAQVGAAAGEVLFVSDVEAELDAARAAGLRTVLCVRGGAPPATATHPAIASFDELP